MKVWFRVYDPMDRVAAWLDGYVWCKPDLRPLVVANDNERRP